ncbi:DEAD/DEAH box helicase [Parenemella sanctibonifatiensis]|uniref:DEAD/DEAH box helicase n=1 Tax=Parenemella sanctibonifatiensis TaxID=2016505 RepID=A0A255E0N6_9ACTN|nr:DEAD/DEAH box helicase [Parenemella sanctibonifatiensis]OYN85137.1 DEAD/DEAH box helicase [Parenemella sanctibonifatiensis]
MHIDTQALVRADPDGVVDLVVAAAEADGLQLYPHQEEALLALVSDQNVVVATPTGSGKSLVAIAAHAAAIARGEVSFYTAPIKALVSEKFFDLCEVFGASNVGMITGDASVNADAPIICCTAEILANIALREGADADVGQVVMDEFHFYSEPDRGWAWQVPLLALPQAQFVLMSATLGPVEGLTEDLTRRTGRETTVLTGVERPIPLTFRYSMDPLPETLTILANTGQTPAYVVHFTQAAALETAQSLLTSEIAQQADKAALKEAIGHFRFQSGFGRTLSKLLRSGIGVHHAGMLPRYRRLVEQLAQAGVLKVICGTDTLGVGINVPIRTVVFTGLAKFDGTKQRLLRAREFHQIAGRAGRAGFDTAGSVVVQAPEHVIENERALAKIGDDAKKRKKFQRRKPPEGTISWTPETFERITTADPEPLAPRLRVTNAMLLNLASRHSDGAADLATLLTDNHQDRTQRRRLVRQAITLTRSLLEAGVLERRVAPDDHGRRYVLTGDLDEDFALNQPLAPFAVAALDTLDADSPDHALDVVSVIESILEDPGVVLYAQQRKAKDEAMAEMKADGWDYVDRMAALEEISWPKPLEELLTGLLETYRETHPWLDPTALAPKSIVRDMYERAMGFSQYVAHYGISRAEGVLLRYLTDSYRTLRHTVPPAHRTEEVEALTDWLGEVVRQTDSSLLDEWEALTSPDQPHRPEVRPARPITTTPAFVTMVRNAMFRKVQLAARDNVDALAATEAEIADLVDPPVDVIMDADAWDDALAAYWDDHDEIGTDAEARGPAWFQVDKDAQLWRVRQTLLDPDGDRDWVIQAEVDLAASEEAGAAVVRAVAMNRLD